ncbi:nucleoside deaminase [Sedimentitalea sp. JM2-8]|uniref:Nucleoside deaminase n=1 Tax=Sedimentitalea xiamensis TaxID=3050037 RepID=A0ABT7FIN2_9RHOB|nr:nucleoside deaminase [Sedimentitalea xiamensis]MDK3074994.1 nucleoside deaminase [Sedimentitalea xiamensis]
MTDEDHMMRAIALALRAADAGNDPFGAVLVRDGRMIAEGMNEVHILHDVTAHAEIQALRAAGRRLESTTHPHSTMFASGKPCAMCMAAMIQAGISRIVYAADDGICAPYGYSTRTLYDRMKGEFGDQGIIVDHLPVAAQRDPFEPRKIRGQK